MRHADLLLAAALLGGAITPGAASAQTDAGLVITPRVPTDYDRGRNISVTERPRPDYDPLGVRAGGLLVLPRVDLGLGYSDNIYLSEAKDRTDSAYTSATASVFVNSDWSRHLLTAQGSGTIRRFLGNSRRNENYWRTAVQGRYDLGTSASITGEVQAGKIYETPFSGEIDATIASLSSYNYEMGGLRAQYNPGRSRYVLAYSATDYSFNRVQLTDSTTLDQSARDRTVQSVVGQAEYALSPSVSLYSQLSYARTDYDRRFNGALPAQNSNGYRLLGGISMDLPSFLRGTVAVGYTIRDFDAAYRQVSGLSADAKLEYFYTELTTVTLSARRLLQDSTLYSSSVFFDNRVSLGVDHELLRNLILNATGEIARQDYTDSRRYNDVYRVGGRANLLVSRGLSTSFAVSESGRVRHGPGNEGSLNEFRAELTLSFRR